MFIETVQNNGNTYLRLVQSVRVKNKDGVSVSGKKVIFNIGPLKKYDDGKPDYVIRLKKSFKDGKPLITSLLPFCTGENSNNKIYRFSVQAGNNDCIGHTKVYSNVLIEKILEEIGLKSLFSSLKYQNSPQFDLYSHIKYLVQNNVLNLSDLSYTSNNSDFFDNSPNSIDSEQIYDTLYLISQHKEKVIKRINSNLTKHSNNGSTLYYDVTNFYQKSKSQYENVIGDTGTSDEKSIGTNPNRKVKPIVQVGLFMNDDGIPIAVESFPEDKMEHIILEPIIDRDINGLGYSRFVKVSNQEVSRNSILSNLIESGNGYILNKSLMNCSFDEQQWAYDNNNYSFASPDFKYKTKTVVRNYTDENGKSSSIEERVIVYWSKHDEDNSVFEYQKLLDFLDILEDSPVQLKSTAFQTQLLKNLSKNNQEKYRTNNTAKTYSSVWDYFDLEKLSNFRNSLGYHQIITSELTMDPLDVIDKYQGITHIEDQFRIMCNNLKSRPIYEQTTECIDAHLLICMITLVVLRLIQKRIIDINNNTEYSPSKNIGMSIERIKRALGKWKIDELPCSLYRFIDIDDPDLMSILNAFDISIPKQLFDKTELRKLKKSLNFQL